MTERDKLSSLETLNDNIRKFHDKFDRKPRPARGKAAAVARVSVELVSGSLVGGFAGYYLDQWLGTSPVLFIVCFFLGSAGGFMTVMRTLKMAEGKEDTKAE